MNNDARLILEASTGQLGPEAQRLAELWSEQAEDAARYRFIRDVPYTDEIRNVMALQQNAIMDETIDSARQRTTGSSE